MRLRLGEKCGIFGVIGKGFEAARLVHPGLWALQHRGQESSGIASSDGKKIFLHKGMGLVSHVFSEEDLKELKGYLAVGHNRYSTSGDSSATHAQPILERISANKNIVLVHNGNLPTTKKLEEFLKNEKISTSGLNDSEMIAKSVAFFMKKGHSLEASIIKAYPLFTGVFCLLIMNEQKIVAVRDSFGIRPLVLGKLNGGHIVASETCALDIIGAKFLREVKPGEMVTISDKGVKSFQIEKGTQKLDVFEFIYFARPDSYILGKSVDAVRQNLGIELAKENKVSADVVIPVPDSAIPAAIGFARESNIPFELGLIKNRYIHRTFISPEEHIRHKIVQLKLNPMPHIISGKRVVIVDDSIVRGTTSRQIIKMIRNAGAKEVHLLVSSPPYKFPDFYGIDTPSQKKLIASTKNIKEIKEELGVDSLHYLSYKGLIKAVGLPENSLCTACFTGDYPVDIGERKKEISYDIVQ
ncbi:MAG: Amidophosphoribosyltransferase [Candidatus Daviesbacteria bacterium GW2011_GWB1_39_5]|uniref:Amidophosphoribosyltransferase n=1 Tax=Candidatus Daviesbacteria bacterium GW2011_GWC2_40_12 TaxID=1618431 RepID=A0A0G0T4B5_9BACT|nr:MAG: Amidophosphoribosyltransferase [Candidatus Daviesbacteria bacterium GW2011_GWA2_39_33]KKR24675.1 MAG: Amidophosphoribosyltransferase [Candidatus Daviesbacteria bacterium GW2011_GWB1_39_5]KKR31786.1 MAG: Amidophosphoribosyltransferase [Parcubacteria group bacterium GW2011_GWF2_39_8b]KKR41955.1 MAG: Amidophosphoribosyltransferase [Candidatus Daviesbacteria bacterium GW2011_GWC2_40_12]OGE21755.1 MAG: amidophosphoribosyltransferase [Candidatus Daviesbacteria bacterium RIFCSPHIGHO2_01_FULL_4